MAAKKPIPTASELSVAIRHFSNFKRAFSPCGDGGYELRFPDAGVTFEVRYLKRERGGEMSGELSVRSTLPEAWTVDGTLSIATFTLTSARARDERAKHLGERCGDETFNWRWALEELCQRVLRAEQIGHPPVAMDQIVSVTEDRREWLVHGLPVLRAMPTLWFGDGGSGKSYLALAVGAALSDLGLPVLFCDWEMYAEEQRARLQRLCGDKLPKHLSYLSCAGSISQEGSRIRAAVLDTKVSFVILDSVAVACGGAPESAEMAGEYHRVIQSLGRVGTLHIAHVSKQHEDAPDPSKPFGSVMWSNFARSTWFLKRANGEDEDNHIDVACFQKKCNATQRHRPVGVRLTFADRRILLASFNVRDHNELAGKLPLWQRIQTALRRGPQSTEQLADILGVSAGHIRADVARYGARFVRLPDSRVALAASEDDGEF